MGNPVGSLGTRKTRKGTLCGSLTPTTVGVLSKRDGTSSYMTYPIGETFRQSLPSSPPCGATYPCRIVLPLPLRAILRRRPNNPCLVTSARWTSIQYHVPPCLTLNRTSIAQTVHHNCHRKPFFPQFGKAYHSRTHQIQRLCAL